ncbi:MAG TPA: NADH-quinone oxidoreductase subunit NuoE [Candidatus Bathyarchaeia archaeon]|nr:NADH-quinone oxidoreductase subunit NuoE [Candidatus Bathyarchaeia archaeon]
MKTLEKDNWPEIETKSKAALSPEIVDFIEARRGGPEAKSHLIQVLHMVQGQFGWLSPERIDAVAQLMQVPAARVSGVATFYHYFRLRPRGKFVIHVCIGTACYVKSAERVAQKLKEELGIDYGETSTDGVFSLEGSRCLGTCGLAPVIMIEDEVHGPITTDQIPAILERYLEKAKKGD